MRHYRIPTQPEVWLRCPRGHQWQPEMVYEPEHGWILVDDEEFCPECGRRARDE